MLLTLMIQVVFSCQIIQKERNIFTTQEEYQNLLMYELFEGDNLIYECQNCPKKVTMWNTMNMIGKPYKTGYIFRSIASNKTHFVGLSQNNTLNIYNWLEQSFNTVQIVPISSELYCINIIFTFNVKFLLDCYKNNELLMYQLEGLNLEQVFKVQTYFPLKANIYSFRSYSRNYTIYAQYYEEYSILTLLKTQNKELVNVSSWISSFQDVEISIKGMEVNTFYVLNNQFIILLQITQDEKFQVQSFFIINPPSYSIKIYQSIKIYSECDQLYLVSDQQIYSILVCADPQDQRLYQQNLLLYSIEENTKVQEFYTNDQFLILQTNSSIIIISKETKKLLRKIRQIGSQLYFNQADNKLFIFNTYVTVYYINIPQLSGNFQDADQKKQEFYVLAFDNYGLDVCLVKLKVQILNSNEFGIYDIYRGQIENYYSLQQKKFVQSIKNIYGPLLWFEYSYDNDNLGSFKNITLQKVYEFNQEFSMMKMLYIRTTYIVGIFNKSMTIFTIELELQEFKNVVIDLDIEEHKIVKDVKLAYQFRGQEIILIIGINIDSNTLLFYYVTQSANTPIVLQNSSVETFHFNDFLLTYNSYILLNDDNLILYSYENNKEYFRVSSESLKDIDGKQIIFNPTGMVLDEQHQSSVVFINNQKSFIVFVIDYNLKMIYQGIYYLDYVIYQMNIVNQKLVMAYKCNQNLCFDVWNTNDLRRAYYEKSMISLSYQNNIVCYSDNQFYYVKQGKNNILVYNPILSYHSSLYMSIQFNGSYFTSTQYYYSLSILAFGNTLYSLLPFFTFEFIRNTDFYTLDYLPTTIYNSTIKSQFNGDNATYLTNNQSLSILNPQLNFYITDIIISISYDSPLKYTFTFDNISTIGQIFYYDLQSVGNRHMEYIKELQNPVQQINQVLNTEQYTIVTVVNNLFILQNYNQIMIFGTNVVTQFKNILNCFQSYAYLDTLYSYCYNTTNYYIVSFSITNTSITQNDQIIVLPTEEAFLFETPFSIISDGIFYISNQGQLAYYNYLSQQNINITNCTSGEFQPIIIKQTNTYCLVVVFYLCTDNFQNLNYIVGNYSKSNYTLQFQGKLKTLNIFKIYFKNINDFYIQYFQVLKVDFKEIILLITTNEQLSFLISFYVQYDTFQQKDAEIRFQDIISTISPYNTIEYELSSSPKISGSNLLIALSNKNSLGQILILVYDLSDISQYSRNTPIRVQGGYIIPEIQSNFLVSYSLTSSYKNKGQILILTSSYIYQLQYCTFTFVLEVPLFSKDKIIQFNLTGQNSYNQYSASIEFHYETQKGWQYALYTILATILTISLIYCWRRRRRPTDFIINNDEWTDF